MSNFDKQGNMYVEGGIFNEVSKGTRASGVSVVEKGDGIHNTTHLTLNTTLGAIAGGADLALGKLIYTFPAGDLLITGAYMSVALTAADGNIDADTPDVGIGTTLGSGAVALLGGTAGFENIVTGQTATNSSGTATTLITGTTTYPLPINSGNPHIVHLNVADGWAASGETACPLTGTVVLQWTKLN